MPKIIGKRGFRFAPGHFGELASHNDREKNITTEGVLEGMAKVERMFEEAGVYEALKKSPYYVVKD